MSLYLFNQNPNVIYGIDLGQNTSSLNTLVSKIGGTGLFGNLNFGNLNLGAIGAGASGIANIVGGIGGLVNARNQLKEQKRAIDIMQNQYNIENQRYNERMAIHDKAANSINESADYFNRD